MTTSLGRRGLLRGPEAEGAPTEPTPAEALTLTAMAKGTVETLRDKTDALDKDEEDGTPPPSDAVSHLGFNLHAGVHLAAHDDTGR